jgi:hypothetical protein
LRPILAAVAFVLLLVVPAVAAGPVFDTPQALLDYAYKPYSTGDFAADDDVLYTKALNDMFASAEAATGEDDVGPIDFDIFVNGQDFQLSDLKYGDPVPEGEGVAVPVTFKNFDEPQSLVFHMVKEGGGWKISDVESRTDGNEWRLTTLLSEPPDDGSDSSQGADDAPPPDTGAGQGADGGN